MPRCLGTCEGRIWPFLGARLAFQTLAPVSRETLAALRAASAATSTPASATPPPARHHTILGSPAQKEDAAFPSRRPLPVHLCDHIKLHAAACCQNPRPEKPFTPPLTCTSPHNHGGFPCRVGGVSWQHRDQGDTSLWSPRGVSGLRKAVGVMATTSHPA